MRRRLSPALGDVPQFETGALFRLVIRCDDVHRAERRASAQSNSYERDGFVARENISPKERHLRFGCGEWSDHKSNAPSGVKHR